MTEIAKDRPTKNNVPEIPVKKLKQLWETQRTTEEIAIQLRVSLTYLHTLARRHNLPKRTHVQKVRRKNGEKEIDPTPEEIIARAAEVRARWTSDEHRRNCCYKSPPVEMPSYSFDGRFVVFNEIRREA